jgi:hypothetical protein
VEVVVQAIAKVLIKMGCIVLQKMLQIVSALQFLQVLTTLLRGIVSTILHFVLKARFPTLQGFLHVFNVQLECIMELKERLFVRSNSGASERSATYLGCHTASDATMERFLLTKAL